MAGMNPPGKICPQCRTLTGLSAPSCSVCGHVYRTQFAQEPPARRTPNKQRQTWMLILGVVVAALILIGTAQDMGQRMKGSSQANGSSQAPASSRSSSGDLNPSDTSAMTTLQLSSKIRPQMTPKEVTSEIGEPDKIQRGMEDFATDEYWYYKRPDGVLQIHFAQYTGLVDKYQTY